MNQDNGDFYPYAIPTQCITGMCWVGIKLVSSVFHTFYEDSKTTMLILLPLRYVTRMGAKASL